MITKNSFVAGRVYSLVYSSPVEMVSKRELDWRTTEYRELIYSRVTLERVDGKFFNPLASNDVTVRRVSTVQAAGDKTWTNYLAKRGEVPSGKPAWYDVSKENSCILVHKTNGNEYLRGLPCGITMEQYFVDGKPASEQQVAIIHAFKKSNSSANEFITLSLSKLLNVDSGQGEAE